MNDSATLPVSQATPEANLLAASADTVRLAEILATEFEALKNRDLEAFESVQDEKAAVLQRLADVAAWAANINPPIEAWLQLQGDLQQCKQDHLRNIQLMQRQLEAVRGTLQALQGESASTLDLYDRMGQVSRRSGAWGYQLA